jgi:RNA polymerase sigma-70 factor (ECF subfamily)
MSSARRRPAAPRSDHAGGWNAAGREALVALLPRLRAFARALAGQGGDDLLQDAVARALAAAPPPVTELSPWLFAIVRNRALNLARRARVERRAAALLEQAPPTLAPAPDSTAEAGEVARAVACLPGVQREALLLVGAHGFSYEEAAAITGAPVGTVKARVARARAALAQQLGAATD